MSMIVKPYTFQKTTGHTLYRVAWYYWVGVGQWCLVYRRTQNLNILSCPYYFLNQPTDVIYVYIYVQVLFVPLIRMSRVRASKSARRTTTLSLYVTENEDGTTILDPALKLEKFAEDEDGPFAELRRLFKTQQKNMGRPTAIPNHSNLEQIAQKIISTMAGEREDPVPEPGNICGVLTKHDISDIHSLSHTSNQAVDLIFCSLNYSIVLLETIITGYALNTKTDVNDITKEVYCRSSAMTSLSSWKSFQKVFGRCRVRRICLSNNLSLKGGSSQDCKEKRDAEMKALEEKHGDDAEAAKVYYNKLLCHYADISLMKDEKSNNFHPGFKAFEDLISQYVTQVHS